MSSRRQELMKIMHTKAERYTFDIEKKRKKKLLQLLSRLSLFAQQKFSYVVTFFLLQILLRVRQGRYA